ncbi:MAG: ribokinase [Lactobacillus sp.]|jgi:ribokinase|nr:ribokinase [Lactobacillus sp.]MCI2034244.1 ribokinase [Lactobacillus sp.]
MKKIAVIGSANTDLVFTTNIIPKMGETVSGERFEMNTGGKGANQAVAIARLGGNVTFFGSLGGDLFGEKIKQELKNENVTICIHDSQMHSGVAQVNLYDHDNSIIVIPGANADFEERFLEEVEARLDEFDFFVFQLEIDINVVDRLVKKIKMLPNKRILLNPAPAQRLTKSLLENSDYITPNEFEIEQIGIDADSTEAALRRYPGKLLVTLGAKGVTYFDQQQQVVTLVPGLTQLNVQDTTGAGDTFTGALSYALVNEYSLKDAIRFANVAAGLSITKVGAQAGMPRLKDVEGMLQR